MTTTQPFDPAPFSAFELGGWERAARHYGDAFGALTMQAGPAVLDAVRVAPGTRLLDVASGPGFIAAAAAARGADVVGLDFATRDGGGSAGPLSRPDVPRGRRRSAAVRGGELRRPW